MAKNVMMERTAEKIGLKEANIQGMTLKIIRKNSCKGLIVAFKVEDKIHIGHSMCRNGDKFDRKMGYSIAMKRAISTFSDVSVVVPESSSDEYTALLGRVYRYFKYEEALYKFPEWYVNFVEQRYGFKEYAQSRKEVTE